MFGDRRTSVSLVAASALIGMMMAGCTYPSRLASGACQRGPGASKVAVQVRNNLNVSITFHVPQGSFAADDWLCGVDPSRWDDAELKPGQSREFALMPNPKPPLHPTEQPRAFPLNLSSGDSKITSFRYAVDVIDQVDRQYIQLADRSRYDCSLQDTWQFSYRGAPMQTRINCQGDLTMTFEYPLTLVP